MIEELRFRQPQQQPKHGESFEDTSIKKCANKYYDYNDRDLPCRRQKIDMSIVDKLNYSEIMNNLVRNKKPLNTSTKCVKTKNKRSQQSQSTIRDSKCQRSISNNFTNPGSRTTKRLTASRDYTKSNSSRDELKYYKKICAQMRKKNQLLQQQLQKKTTENKQNIKNLENQLKHIGEQVDNKMQSFGKSKYKDLMEQMTIINEKLTKKELKNQKYRKFFVSVVESLELLGFEQQHPEIKEIWKIWKNIIHYLISQKYQLPK